MRVVKAPEERRKEILETAMRLFTENGYEATSMRDIAKEMGVVQGLCYRYFDSKQALFEEAMETYVRECCAGFLQILHNPSKSLREKLDAFFDALKQEGETLKYHGFFHQAENKELHELLSLKFCKYMRPHLLKELQRGSEHGDLRLKSPEILVDFIIYGQISLLADSRMPRDEVLAKIREYIDVLLKSQRVPD